MVEGGGTTLELLLTGHTKMCAHRTNMGSGGGVAWSSHQLGARTSSGSGPSQGHIPAGRLNSADVMLTTDGGSGGGM